MPLEEKILTGREASILCFFAQIRNNKDYIHSQDYREITQGLTKYVLSIGEAIFGLRKKKDKEILNVADGFIHWANSLGPHRKYESPTINSDYMLQG